MKTLIFSDTHLGTFDKNLFHYLSNLFNSVDTIIINGDFWEGQSFTFDEFVHSEWQKLFPILKSKNTIYLYGNHDRKRFCDERVDLFSVKQGEEYILPVGEKILHIEHGHIIVPFNDDPNAPILTYKNFNEMYSALEGFFVSYFFELPLHVYKLIFGRRMKKHAKKNLKENEILVTGHIHGPEFDIKNKHINTFMRHGKAYYLIIEDGELTFVKEKIQ